MEVVWEKIHVVPIWDCLPFAEDIDDCAAKGLCNVIELVDIEAGVVVVAVPWGRSRSADLTNWWWCDEEEVFHSCLLALVGDSADILPNASGEI